MRAAIWLICCSVALCSAAKPQLAGTTVKIEGSVAGQPVQFRVLGDGDGARKVRTTVKRRDGTRVELPAMVLTLPLQPPRFEGPTIPPGSQGGTLIVELIDPETGEVVDTGVAPIG